MTSIDSLLIERRDKEVLERAKKCAAEEGLAWSISETATQILRNWIELRLEKMFSKAAGIEPPPINHQLTDELARGVVAAMREDFNRRVVDQITSTLKAEEDNGTRT